MLSPSSQNNDPEDSFSGCNATTRPNGFLRLALVVTLSSKKKISRNRKLLRKTKKNFTDGTWNGTI